MSIPTNYQFLDSHEWINLSESPSPMGISDFAQQELTDIVYVELPEVGAEVEAGDTIAVVESVKSASDIYSPVTGTIVEVNEELNDNPALVNEDAFGKGWIAKFESKGEVTLLSAEDYGKQVG